MVEPDERLNAGIAAMMRGSSGRYPETGSIGALVAGSIAVAQTIWPSWIASVVLTGVAAAPPGAAVIACGLGLAGGTKRGSPPPLISMAQTRARLAALSDRS